MQRHWIDTPDALQHWLREVPPVIGLDTEFIRERTYWPILALVQIALGDAQAGAPILLVDATVPGMPQALAPLLSNPAITKVMHSASEDLVALQRSCAVAPWPLFDTQIAAALAGVGGGLGYQKLVQALEGVELAKGQTRSNWLRRPLSEEQLHYAAEDVLHLARLHAELTTRLQAQGRGDWQTQDAARLLAACAPDADDRWPHMAVRGGGLLDAAGQQRLLRLMRWREARARERDLPRTWVLDNELLHGLARNPPADQAAMRDRLAATPKAPRQSADALCQALHTPLADEATMPFVRDDALDKARLKRAQDAVAQLSTQHGLPEGLLASRRWLQAWLDGDGAWPAALEGWRRTLLEPVLLPLLRDGDAACLPAGGDLNFKPRSGP